MTKSTQKCITFLIFEFHLSESCILIWLTVCFHSDVLSVYVLKDDNTADDEQMEAGVWKCADSTAPSLTGQRGSEVVFSSVELNCLVWYAGTSERGCAVLCSSHTAPPVSFHQTRRMGAGAPFLPSSHRSSDLSPFPHRHVWKPDLLHLLALLGVARSPILHPEGASPRGAAHNPRQTELHHWRWVHTAAARGFH